MTRNGTWLLAILAVASAATSDDALVERWDKPRRETLALLGMQPGKVVEELRKRYGIPFKAEEKDLRAAGLAVENATFLEALDRFAAAQGLSLVGVPAPEERREHDQEALALVRTTRPLGPTPVAYAGPTRLSVQGLAARTTRVFAAEGPRVGPACLFTAWSDLEDESRLRIVFKWIVEPGLEDLMVVQLRLAAEDDAGNALCLSRGLACEPGDVDLRVRANRNFSVDLDPPSPEARAIGRLVCAMKVAWPAERSEVEFLAKDVGTTKQLGGCEVTLVEARDKLARFAFDGTPCPEVGPTGTFASSGAGRASIDQMALVAFGAGGEPIEQGSRCGGTACGSRATCWTEWEKPPARFAVRAVTKVALKDARFAFSDVPLPE